MFFTQINAWKIYSFFFLIDRPLPPLIKNFDATSTSIKLTWDYQSTPIAPITGKYIQNQSHFVLGNLFSNNLKSKKSIKLLSLENKTRFPNYSA